MDEFGFPDLLSSDSVSLITESHMLMQALFFHIVACPNSTGC